MELFKIFGSVAIDNAKAKQELDELNTKAKTVSASISQALGSIGSTFTAMGQSMANLGSKLTVGLTVPIAGLVASGIKYNAQMETFEANLTTLLGSSDKASKLLSDLQEMAATTPYETTDLISATQTMIGFGISAEDAQGYLKVLGDIAMGDSQKMSGLALAFSQVQSTGKLTGQDLLQMINQGFNPLLYISKMTGKSMAELKEEMGKGQISAKMVGDAFEYATQKGQPFYQAMEKGANTINGRISTLKDNFNIMIGTLTESLLPIFEKIVDKAIELTEKFSNLTDEQKEQILMWAGIVASIGPVLVVLGKLTSAVGIITTGIGKLVEVFGASGTAGGLSGAMSNLVSACGGLAPFLGIITAVIIALISVVQFLKANWDKVTETIQKFIEKTKLKEKFEEIREKLQPLMEKLEGLGDLFEVIGGFLVMSLLPAIATIMGIIDGVVSAIGPLLDALGGLLDILGAIGSFIKSVFTGDWQGALDALKKGEQGTKDLFMGILEAIGSFFYGLIEGFISFWTSLSDSVGLTQFQEDMLNKLKNWWTSSVIPWWNEIWASVKEFFNGLATWFNDNVTTPINNFFIDLFTSIRDGFNTAVEWVKGIWNSVATWFNTNVIEPIKTFFQPLVDWFTKLFGEIRDFVVSVWNVISELAQGCRNAIMLVWGIITNWFNENIIQPVKNFFISLWNSVKTTAQTAWNFIKNVWNAVSSWFNSKIINPVRNAFTSFWNKIKSLASSCWNGIKSVWNAVSNWFNNTIINPVKNTFTSLWNTLKNGASKAWQGIKDVFSKVSTFFKDTFQKAWQKVKDVFSTGGRIFDGIKEGIVSAFKNVVNGIIRGINRVVKVPFDGINTALDRIRNISIAGAQPFSGLISRINVPQIPELEEGAVLEKGEVGLLEGKGAEAVVPLHQNKKWVSAVAQDMQDAFGFNNSNLEEKLNTVIDVLYAYMPMLAERQLVLDSGEMVGALAYKMDRKLGDISKKKTNRGR